MAASRRKTCFGKLCSTKHSILLHFFCFLYHSGGYGLWDKKENISVFMGWKVGIFKISFDFMGESIKAKTDGRTGDKKSKLVQLGFMCKEFMEKLI